MKKTTACLLLMLLIWSCQKEGINILVGDNFINAQTTFSLIDTVSVQLSTFKIDSIATSSSGYAMAGGYVDEEFGVVASVAYLQIDRPIENIAKEEIFDSLVIILPYSGISYGDTLKPQTLSVHRVLEDIEPAGVQPDLFNSTTFEYERTSLGEITVKPRPNFHDVLEIRLKDELGLELIGLLQDEGNSSGNFMENFKGIALVPGRENNSLLSFIADTLFHLELYTHILEETKTSKRYALPYSISNRQFNHIYSDVSNLPLSKLGSQKNELKSNLLGNKSYLQAGVGIVTRVDFPGISSVLEDEKNSILYKAELIVKPRRGTYKNIPLPPRIVLFRTDKNNALVSEIKNVGGSSSYAEFYYDELYDEANFYRFDITEFMLDELKDGFVDPDNGLLIMLPGNQFMSTVDRIVFDARGSLEYRPRLNLYFMFYE